MREDVFPGVNLTTIRERASSWRVADYGREALIEEGAKNQGMKQRIRAAFAPLVVATREAQGQ